MDDAFLTILVVDDNPVEQRLLAGLLRKLKRWRVEVTVAATGREAFQRLRERMPDVVLLDYRLEGEKGTELLISMTEAGCTGGFIMVTGMEGDEAVVAALRAGAHDYIHKSELNVDSLGRAVYHALEASRTSRELKEANRQLALARESLEQRVASRTHDLCKAREQMDFITGAANDAIVMLDPLGRVVFWNRAAERIFGIEEARILGRPVVDFLIPPSERDLFSAGFHAFASSGRGEVVGKVTEHLALHQEGQLVPVEVSVSAIEIDQGWHAVGIVRDVTERRRARRELERAKEEAENATRLKDRFVSLVAHDLKGPFTTITGFLELLERDEKHPLSRKQKGYLSWIGESSRRMVRMIDEILDISRLQTGKVVPRPRFVDARFLGEKALDGLRPLASKKKVVLENHLPEGFRLFADPELFGEVLQNLVGNAVKFCRPGDVITLFRSPRDRATVAVKDTGVGIGRKRLEKLFRLDEKNSTPGTDGEPGTGYGLPFSQEIMKAQGGSLTVKSREGKGSTFYATLPEVTPQVLLVDDDPDFRQFLARPLGRLGVEVIGIGSGEEALEQVEKGLPHLIICDIQMPGLDGFQFAAELKKNPSTREIPIILVTADDAIATRERAFLVGACDFVTKPIVATDFLPRVRRIVG
ncbi:MAG: response regulator [Magnetococcales bacterium]|nr:response regulator [Magnetococcales bacterium]MBF0156126.1 response regulator [Magnetococcales bacterium]